MVTVHDDSSNELARGSWPCTGRALTRLGFGAMGFAEWYGEGGDEPAMVRSLLTALERGVDFIDTARGYGRSEAVIARALRDFRGPAPFIATKASAVVKDNAVWAIPPAADETYPPGHLRKNLEESLRVLGLERIDLLQLHLYWPTWGVHSRIFDELLQLKYENKVAFVGVSAPDHRADVVLPLVMSGLIDSVQAIINIFDPLALDCLLPICRERKVAVIARGIMDEGGLSGFLRPDTRFEESAWRRVFFEAVPREQYIERVDALRKFVPEHAPTLAALAIKFVLHEPAVTAAITSMHVREQLEENLASLASRPLPGAVFEELRRKHRWVRNFFDRAYFA